MIAGIADTFAEAGINVLLYAISLSADASAKFWIYYLCLDGTPSYRARPHKTGASGGA